MSLSAVYGTLRKGLYNHKNYKLDINSKFISKGKIKGYVMLDMGGYPIITKVPDNYKDKYFSIVEVIDITNSIIEKEIDYLESSFGYIKKELDVELEDGTIIKANAYVADIRLVKFSKKVIPDGEWVNYYINKYL